MDGFAIVPAAVGEGFVELARSRQGRVFEKHILNYGPLLYPGVAGGKVEIDDAFADTLIENFRSRVCPIVQVPLAGPRNEHSEDPSRNIGEVIGLVKRGGHVYARIDARDQGAAEKLGKTLLGASAMLHLNYTDTRNGQKVGPTLLHVAVTNRPYVVDLEDYEEMLAASATGVADGMANAVVLTAPTTEDTMTLDEMLAELKADHGIDVRALTAAAAMAPAAVALSAAVTEALTQGGMLTLSADQSEPSTEELVAAIKTAGTQIVTLTAQNAEIVAATATKDAEAHVDGLVRTGHILPKSRDANVSLLLSNPTLFDALLPEKPLVALSQEVGTDPADESAADAVKDEIARLTTSAAAKQYVH